MKDNIFDVNGGSTSVFDVSKSRVNWLIPPGSDDDDDETPEDQEKEDEQD